MTSLCLPSASSTVTYGLRNWQAVEPVVAVQFETGNVRGRRPLSDLQSLPEPRRAVARQSPPGPRTFP